MYNLIMNNFYFVKSVINGAYFTVWIKTLNLYILKPTDEFYYKILKEERSFQNSLDVIDNQDDVKKKLNFNLIV